MDKRAFNKAKRREKFSKTLYEAMKEKGITQSNLADILNTTQQTVSRWCKGMCEPDYDTLILLCGILDETPNDFLDYDGNFAEQYAIYLLIDNVADTKEYRSFSRQLADKVIKREITVEEKARLEKEKLNELYRKYCEEHGIKDKPVDITKMILD